MIVRVSPTANRRLVERDYGHGRVVLFASTADTEWNDLGARAGVWVPLVQRTLGHWSHRRTST